VLQQYAWGVLFVKGVDDEIEDEYTSTMPRGKRPHMKRVIVALPPDELDRLDDLAERLALARSSLIRLMVLEGLEKRETREPPKAD